MPYKVRTPSTRFFKSVFSFFETRGGFMFVIFFGRLFRRVTPAFAEPYKIDRSGFFPQIFWLIFIAAIFYCFFLTAIFTITSGTFSLNLGPSLGFLEDRWNMFLYFLICPAYVTLCIRMVILALERESDNNKAYIQHTLSTQTKRLFLNIFLITVFSSILITNYVKDALDPSVVFVDYWFVENISGIRRLNGAGLYYIVLNFSLLFVTFLGGSAFISISLDGIGLSKILLMEKTDFKTYKARLDRLVHAYYLGVYLVACYAINIIIWKHSPLGATFNIHIAGAAFTAIGIFFVTVPRRFIEHRWAEYCARLNVQESIEIEHQEIIPPEQASKINILQLLILAGWFPNFYNISDYINLYYWINLFFGNSS